MQPELEVLSTKSLTKLRDAQLFVPVQPELKCGNDASNFHIIVIVVPKTAHDHWVARDDRPACN